MVRNDILTAFWQAGKPLPQTALVRYLEQNLHPIARYGGYVISARGS